MECESRFSVSIKGILVKENKFLIIKRPMEEKSRGGFWEFPGGGLQFGETPEEALKREFFEETGLDVKILKPIYTWSIIKGKNQQVVGIHFLCKAIKDIPIILSSEHSIYAWTTIEELDNYPVSPCIKADFEKYNLIEMIDEAIKNNFNLI